MEETISGEGHSSTELAEEGQALTAEPMLTLDGSTGELDGLDEETDGEAQI